MNIAQEILGDADMQKLLKEIILEKADYLEQLKTKREAFIRNPKYEGLKNEDKGVVEAFYDYLVDAGEMKTVERDLNNACYQYAKKFGKLPEITKWEQRYKYATQEVEITKVIEHLMSSQNFRRNLVCPFHKDKTPSLKVYSKTNSFYCFGCGAGGSAVNFVMLYQHCSFKEAVNFISNI